MPQPSTPPPPDQIPGHSSGGGLYLAGAVVLIGGAIGLFVWNKGKTAPKPTAPTAVVAQSAAAPRQDEPQRLYAPPPPPKLDDEPDAGAPSPKASAKASGSPAAGTAPGPCGPSCNGETTGALSAALRARAQSAQGCYQRALRTSEVSGSMTVSVQIGPSGQVCSASLSNDSVKSSEVTSCVLGRFRGQTFPPPSGGCIVANIPISFTIKQ